MKKVGIIGAGASGLMAAIEAAGEGAAVTLFEKKDRVGKKILVTGNGRCNFTNANISKDYYYTDDDDFVERVLSKFGNSELLMYFTGLGLLIREKNGYFYPSCEQASAVLDLLRQALSEKNVDVKTDSNVISVLNKNDKYVVKLENGDTYEFDAVIVSTGGKAGLAPKETVNGYDILNKLDHKSNKLYPALTQIKCDGLNFKGLSGVKSDCVLYLFADENLIMSQGGELLFTDSGISGIVSFQISHCVAEFLDNKKKVEVVLDLLPGIEEENLKAFIVPKMLLHPNQTLEEFFVGLHNKKLNTEIIKRSGLKPSMKVSDVDKDTLLNAVLSLKEVTVKATDVNGFDKAQVTGGGILTSEVTDDLESKLHKNLFITGELLNVDGLCGGYNLQWAFSTGIIAGRAAGKQEDK
ncbi:MAG: aminoacetone oxidase family FAD-binding enzyme [Lachnospiraceae bacterium]|nr:aminoacetone oxidase family FAD-binding enzyme [Lachnospiraceae bacterium]